MGQINAFFSTSHVIPHDRAMVLVPGVVYLHALQKVISVRHMGLTEVSAFTVHLLLTCRRNVTKFERASLAQLGFEPGTSCT